MLTLLSHDLREQAGLVDPENPVLTIRIGNTGELAVFLTPSDGEDGPHTRLIRQRLTATGDSLPRGPFIFRVSLLAAPVILADDERDARRVLDLFRRDLVGPLDDLDGLVRALPTKDQLAKAVDWGLGVKLGRMVETGTVIDPREMRLVARCPACSPIGLALRQIGLAEAIERMMDEATGEDAPSDKCRTAFAEMTRAPKPNEIFGKAPVPHGHPFFDLGVQLMQEAGGELMRQRTPEVVRGFLQRSDQIASALREMGLGR